MHLHTSTNNQQTNMAHIIGSILPAYIAKNEDWDIVDYHKAMNVSKEWHKHLVGTKVIPSRLFFDCTDVIFPYEKLNMYLKAICKGEMSVKRFLHILDSGQLFPKSADLGSVVKTIRTMKNFITRTWIASMTTRIDNMVNYKKDRETRDKIEILLDMMIFAICSSYADMVIKPSPLFKSLCLDYMNVMKRFMDSQYCKKSLLKKTDYLLMLQHWKRYYANIKYTKSFYVFTIHNEIFSVWRELIEL